MRIVDALNKNYGDQFDINPGSSLQFRLQDLLPPGSIANLLPPADLAINTPGVTRIVTYNNPGTAGVINVWDGPSVVIIDDWYSTFLAVQAADPQSSAVGILSWVFGSAVTSFTEISYADGQPLFPTTLRNTTLSPGQTWEGAMFVDLTRVTTLRLNSSNLAPIRFKLDAVVIISE